MSLITNNIKAILAIKIKTRHDSYTDQFSRIFMVKMFIIASLVMGVDWFNDTVACIVPKNSDLSSNFVHSACWIQGFYVYPAMTKRLQESSYYGIPSEMDFNGQTESGELCAMYNRKRERNEGCRPMRKLYYLQYQYMPFYIASLAILFYMPYVMFRIVNTDMISLRTTLEKEKIDSAKISKNYFNYNVNSKRKMRVRVSINIVIKIIYILVNVLAFLMTDILLLGNFTHYGIHYAKWARMNHTSAYGFYEGDIPKPGNVLLPSFGFCEIQEGSLDIRQVFFNQNKFICEISPNILYQYVLLVLWFVMVTSLVISVLGLLLNLLGHVESQIRLFKDECPIKNVLKVLTLRECEYLTFIRRKNIPLYGDVMRYLNETRHDLKDVNGNVDYTPFLQQSNHKEATV